MGEVTPLSFYFIFWIIEGIAFLIAGIYCIIILFVSRDIIFNQDIGQNIRFIMITNLIIIFIRVLILIPFYIIKKPFENEEKETKTIYLFLILWILTDISLGITLYYTSDTYKNKLVTILINKGSTESKQVLKSKLDIQIKPIKIFSIISLILVNTLMFLVLALIFDRLKF